ncbi:hypothetical protein SAMN04489716_5023 [Actinoplanes derwentensis]|uniref:Uncharacterized protein n=1 Tax=Actinoplanes derwentensis TaxID=113562 RepID=A0A1H2BY05_9ACTN|nr:hypothetical protein SAMN04489716_5023 [Actinoplanes derwentensis]
MSQPALFSVAGMRDRTKSKNYCPDRDEFRRDHERRRAWGLQRRHTEKLRRIRERDSMPLSREDREWLASLTPRTPPASTPPQAPSAPTPPQTPAAPEPPRAPAAPPAPPQTPAAPAPPRAPAVSEPTRALATSLPPQNPAAPAPMPLACDAAVVQSGIAAAPVVSVPRAGAAARRGRGGGVRADRFLVPGCPQLGKLLPRSGRGGSLLNEYGAGRTSVTVALGAFPDGRVRGGHRAMAGEQPCKFWPDLLCSSRVILRIVWPKSIGRRSSQHSVSIVRRVGVFAIPYRVSGIRFLTSGIRLHAPVRNTNHRRCDARIRIRGGSVSACRARGGLKGVHSPGGRGSGRDAFGPAGSGVTGRDAFRPADAG